VAERIRRVAGIMIPVIAIAVIVVGLWPTGETSADPEVRARHVAANIKCPFCSGESIAESTSAVAGDYEVLIEELVADGWSDQEIYDEFAARFGDGILLDPAQSAWGIALWAVPLVALVVGALVILDLRRADRTVAKVPEEVP